MQGFFVLGHIVACTDATCAATSFGVQRPAIHLLLHDDHEWLGHFGSSILISTLHCSSLNRVICCRGSFFFFLPCTVSACRARAVAGMAWSIPTTIVHNPSAEATEMPTIFVGAMLWCYASKLGEPEKNLTTRQGFPRSNSTALNWELHAKPRAAQVYTAREILRWLGCLLKLFYHVLYFKLQYVNSIIYSKILYFTLIV